MLTKLVILTASISFLPVTLYLIKTLIYKGLKDYKAKVKEEEKHAYYVGKAKHKEKIKDIYEKEREPYYQEARILFNFLMKNKKLNHDQILLVRKMLEDELGEYVHEFDDYTRKTKVKDGDEEKIIRKKGFENDCHRIYVYMKSYAIDVPGWKKIISFLEECV